MGARSIRDECRGDTRELLVLSITPTAEIPCAPLFVISSTILTRSFVPSEDEQNYILHHLDNSYYARAGGRK